MTGDMRETFRETREALEESLDGEALTPEQKKTISTAMRFGYSAAFCSRTCDMNRNFFAAQRYVKEYEQILEKLEK